MKKEKKTECKECKKLQELINKRYYEDLERSKSFRELNSKYVELQKENKELEYNIADKVNTIMFLCWMLVREWVHTKSYGTTLKRILLLPWTEKKLKILLFLIRVFL